jgi:hypothetical protein
VFWALRRKRLIDDRLDRMGGQGYACKVCHGWDSARNEIQAYLQ